MKLIFVHGRDQQGKIPVALQSEWDTAWNEGLIAAGLTRRTPLDVIFPFYGDKLDALVKATKTPLVAGVLARGAGDTFEAEFRGNLIVEMAQNAGVTDADILRNTTEVVTEKGPLNWGWVQSILRALDELPGGETWIDIFTRDVYVYLTFPAIREQIDAIVNAAIPDEPCVVVGHSLGSVVAYNVLMKRASPTNVRGFVTVGSPLGMRTIQRYLTKPTAIPTVIKTWFNGYDDADVVALRALDGHEFPGTPLIENVADIQNATDNHHGIIHYLDKPAIATWIHQSLTAPL